MTLAEIGVFGGSGFYSLGDGDLGSDATEVVTEVVTEVAFDTPYGPPAAPITVAQIGGRRVAFLPRHGRNHEFGPAQIPYRANVWAMQEMGVRAIVAPCAVGSLQPEVHPGEFVVVDQLLDRTWGRADTFHDGMDGRPVFHVPFADPYDAALRAELVKAGRAQGIVVHDGGAMVVIQGPRFSTRAESRWFRDMGWTVVNMTGYPEAVLAAELKIPYAAVALVTDYDAGLDGVEPVTQEQVFTFFEQNVSRVRDLLFAAIPSLPLT